ncbi:pyridoxal-phosphate dependent enzyme [Marinicella sp. W31]|uniref:pyridoxal-phosphate dependent enzyme n=1 Tax=Marinicella sp. W31 TaxID=3023713 RepID=UPI0037581C39
MNALHIETPLLESRALEMAEDSSVWLKCDNMQPTGSFKIRGIGLACKEYLARGAQQFITSSGGNAGIAVAYAGRCLSVPVKVVVPETTSALARRLIQQEAAELIVIGDSWYEANEAALAMQGADDAFIHPFDDPLLWRGHATVIDEVKASGVTPDAVVLSVGGGGLLCGVIEGLERNDWSDIPVFAVETQGADSLAQSLQAQKRVTLPAITSVATSLGAKQIGEKAFELSQQYAVQSLLVSDQAAVQACHRLLTEQRFLVEPACGASMAVLYDQAPELLAYKSILVIVCGGATMSLEQLNNWKSQFQST